MSKKKNILFVPLDWGLGHITRCIPLINEFKLNNCSLFIAGEEMAKELLNTDLQDITFIYKNGYHIRYSNSKFWFRLKIFSQLPKILTAIYAEHQWLKKIVKKYSIDAIVADNRFGLYHANVPSVYITHQLRVKVGNNFLEQIAQQIHYWFIKKYTTCWVPDFEGPGNISGDLSQPSILPPNINYIGCLSRFIKKPPTEKLYTLLIILSGPEPQRTIFENLLLEQIKNHPGSILFVRGLPGIGLRQTNGLSNINGVGSNTIIKNHLAAEELNEAIQLSEMVISRSGYTTIMDLIKLGQKAILVPTPGQTEQEYLAKYLMEQHFFYSETQENFVLEQVLKRAATFPFSHPTVDMNQYKKVVAQFVQSL